MHPFKIIPSANSMTIRGPRPIYLICVSSNYDNSIIPFLCREALVQATAAQAMRARSRAAAAGNDAEQKLRDDEEAEEGAFKDRHIKKRGPPQMGLDSVYNVENAMRSQRVFFRKGFVVGITCFGAKFQTQAESQPP
jgi:hypothetical protein